MIQSDKSSRIGSTKEGKQAGFLHPNNAKSPALHVPYCNVHCPNDQADATPGKHWMTPDDAFTKGGFGE